MSDIVILKLGTAIDSLRTRRGDFEDYFAAGLGIPIASCRIIDPRQTDAFPPHDECRAVVITGSPEMITDDPDWSLNSERWIRKGIDHGTPHLGICYGHQILAKVLGAPVDWAQHGTEIGTVSVEIFQDAWADGFWHEPPARLTVQTCHSQSVQELPSGARLLASNKHDRIQGFAWGRHVWGFQFHPEFDADILAGYINAESRQLERAGLDPRQMLNDTRDSDDGPRLLRAFAQFAGMHQ